MDSLLWAITCSVHKTYLFICYINRTRSTVKKEERKRHKGNIFFVFFFPFFPYYYYYYYFLLRVWGHNSIYYYYYYYIIILLLLLLLLKFYTALRHRSIQSDCKSKCMPKYRQLHVLMSIPNLQYTYLKSTANNEINRTSEALQQAQQ